MGESKIKLTIICTAHGQAVPMIRQLD